MNTTELQIWIMVISLSLGFLIGHYCGFMRALKKLLKEKNDE